MRFFLITLLFLPNLAIAQTTARIGATVTIITEEYGQLVDGELVIPYDIPDEEREIMVQIEPVETKTEENRE